MRFLLVSTTYIHLKALRFHQYRNPTRSITTNSNSTFNVKITDRISAIGGITSYFPIDYAEGNSITAFKSDSAVQFLNNSGVTTGHSASAAYTPASVKDW